MSNKGSLAQRREDSAFNSRAEKKKGPGQRPARGKPPHRPHATMNGPKREDRGKRRKPPPGASGRVANPHPPHPTGRGGRPRGITSKHNARVNEAPAKRNPGGRRRPRDASQNGGPGLPAQNECRGDDPQPRLARINGERPTGPRSVLE